MSDLERALAFMRELTERMAEEVVPFRYGRAFFNRSFGRVWDLNLLAVETEELPPADDLVEEAERLHGERGQAHRRVNLPGEEPALFDELRGRGWLGERHLVMAHRHQPDRDGEVEVHELALDDPALRAARDDYIRTQPWGADAETREQLLDVKELVAAATRLRFFAAFAGDEVASFCELYSDGRTAQIEDMITLERFRRQGLASAVVLRALQVARDEGHDLVFLVADAEDWPKDLYTKLGFETVGPKLALLFTPERWAQTRRAARDS
jgi:ribosomal protein S18 acetylase RimI-like enzyme